ncbi:MAG: hypothetical protein IKP28_02045 [Clostridia bacterium]|nr:hypothetical protein [Clostridia bacterium]
MCKKIFVMLFIFFCMISLLNLNKASAAINVKPVVLSDGGGVCRHTYVNKALPKYIKSYATCTRPAVYYKSCSKCGARGTGTFTSGSALGHQLSTPRMASNLKSAATCTTPAVYYKYCLRCRQNVSVTFTYGKSLGHNYIENKNPKYIKSYATCENPAVYYKSCSRCGQKGTATFTSGEALGHELSMPRWGSNLKSAATCTNPAVYYKYCLRCRQNVDETFTYGKALGHEFGNGNECSRCGLKRVQEPEYTVRYIFGRPTSADLTWMSDDTWTVAERYTVVTAVPGEDGGGYTHGHTGSAITLTEHQAMYEAGLERGRQWAMEANSSEIVCLTLYSQAGEWGLGFIEGVYAANPELMPNLQVNLVSAMVYVPSAGIKSDPGSGRGRAWANRMQVYAAEGANFDVFYTTEGGVNNPDKTTQEAISSLGTGYSDNIRFHNLRVGHSYEDDWNQLENYSEIWNNDNLIQNR